MDAVDACVLLACICVDRSFLSGGNQVDMYMAHASCIKPVAIPNTVGHAIVHQDEGREQEYPWQPSRLSG